MFRYLILTLLCAGIALSTGACGADSYKPSTQAPRVEHLQWSFGPGGTEDTIEGAAERTEEALREQLERHTPTSDTRNRPSPVELTAPDGSREWVTVLTTPSQEVIDHPNANELLIGEYEGTWQMWVGVTDAMFGHYLNRASITIATIPTATVAKVHRAVARHFANKVGTARNPAVKAYYAGLSFNLGLVADMAEEFHARARASHRVSVKMVRDFAVRRLGIKLKALDPE